MEPTSRVSSQVAQVVPFHCIICFDQFNLTDKAPVILPCGHTYLCEPCSKRIKTCMECRSPLFWTPPPRPAAPLTPYRSNQISQQRARFRDPHSMAPPSPVKPPEPVPLPIPKNVVLLAMLEAAERQSMMAASVMDISQDDIEEEGISGQVEDDDAEVKSIIAGMESLTGPCGTYAVSDAEGLAVLSQDPRRRNHEQVRDPAESRDPFTVEKGQTIQVVGIDNGVVKMARGMGYIVASDTQLVKVGGPLDRSCQLEGTLDMVEQRRLELQRQLAQIERLSDRLKTEIDQVEAEDPTHPIITLPPSMDAQEEVPNSCPGTPDRKLETPTLSESPTVVTQGADGVELTHSPLTPGRDPSLPAHLGSPFSIDNADIASAFPRRLTTTDDGLLSIYQRMEDNDPPGIVDIGCSSFLFGRICASEDDDEGARQLIGLSFDDSEGSTDVMISPPRPTALPPSLTATPSMGRGSASPSPSQRPLPSPARTQSFDTIDFRTGMSCHRALGSTRAADPRANRGNIRMMSQHMGIGRIRGPSKSSASSVSSTKGDA